jgi:hypothetical protein
MCWNAEAEVGVGYLFGLVPELREGSGTEDHETGAILKLRNADNPQCGVIISGVFRPIIVGQVRLPRPVLVFNEPLKIALLVVSLRLLHTRAAIASLYMCCDSRKGKQGNFIRM